MDEKHLKKELLNKNLNEIENLSKNIKNCEKKIKQQLLLVNQFYEIQNIIYQKQKNKETDELEELSNLALKKSEEIINLIGKKKFEFNETGICYGFRGLNLHKKYNK